MIRLTLILLLSCMMQFMTAQEIEETRMQRVVGANLPWNNFGWDFGIHEQWGPGYDSTYFDQAMADLNQQGFNVIRVWMHCDGRANPSFDQAGFVTGIDDYTINSLQHFLDLAESHELSVLLVLWSHDMFEDYQEAAGPYAGMHADLVQDPAKRASYIDNALVPLMQAIADHPAIYGIELINEPEWAMDLADKPASTEQRVDFSAMQAFLGEMIRAIRAQTSFLITIGCARPFGLANNRENIWSRFSFEAAGFHEPKVKLDFYSFHWFPWMGGVDCPIGRHASSWELDLPILISEFPAGYESIDATIHQLNAIHDKGYLGIMFWSYNAGDDIGDWSITAPASLAFSQENPNFATALGIYQFANNNVESTESAALLYPNPATASAVLRLPESTQGRGLLVSDITGQTVYQSIDASQEYNIPIAHLPAGWYAVTSLLSDGSEVRRVLIVE